MKLRTFLPPARPGKLVAKNHCRRNLETQIFETELISAGVSLQRSVKSVEVWL